MNRILIALVCVMAATCFTAQAQKKAPKPVVIELNFRNADDTGMNCLGATAADDPVLVRF